MGADRSRTGPARFSASAGKTAAFVGGAGDAPFQVDDRPGGQARRLGQFLLVSLASARSCRSRPANESPGSATAQHPLATLRRGCSAPDRTDLPPTLRRSGRSCHLPPKPRMSCRRCWHRDTDHTAGEPASPDATAARRPRARPAASSESPTPTQSCGLLCGRSRVVPTHVPLNSGISPGQLAGDTSEGAHN